MFQNRRASSSQYSQLPSLDSGREKWNSESCSKNSTTTTLCVYVFGGFLLARIVSALFNNINDCDETFNYWEPAHYLLYGRGFQTWEYSPRYAIRSYLYLWLYIGPAKLLSLIGLTNVQIFFGLRILLAAVSALCETFLFSAISKSISSQIAVSYAVISMISAGAFSATTAFLPSSFGYYTTCLVVAFWLKRKYSGFIFFTAFGTILGWPFTAAISLPAALTLIFKKPIFFISRSLFFGTAILSVALAVDSFYYGKFVFASLNIVLYNIFSSHGPDLYGTEKFSFYIFNLILNYNLAFVGAAVALFTIVLGLMGGLSKQEAKAQFTVLAPLYVWWAIFFTQAHKEERFMYPVYPLIALGAAIAFQNVYRIFPRNILFRVGKIALFVVFALASISRVFALVHGYGASLAIYHDIPHENATLCLGKEWHRFPSNFLVPNSIRVDFLPSEFRGQLPRHYEQTLHATRIVPEDFNDANLEETSRYVELNKCDFIIDTDFEHHEGRDVPYSRQPDKWFKVASHRFLDASDSHSVFRAFYVPLLTESRCKFIDYNLLRRIK